MSPDWDMDSTSIRLSAYLVLFLFLFLFRLSFPYYSVQFLDAKVSQWRLGSKTERAHVAGAATVQLAAAAAAAMGHAVVAPAGTTSPGLEQQPLVCRRAKQFPNLCASRRKPATAVALARYAPQKNDRIVSSKGPKNS